MATTLARENVKHNIERNKKAYDATAKDPNFKIGQTVLLHTPHVQKGLSSKLQIKWKGSYYIVECCQNHTYVLRHANTHVLMKTVVHANRLKPFNESVNEPREEVIDEGDDSDEADTPEDRANKQTDSDVNGHVINRQVDHSNDNNVQADQSQEEHAQNKIERVLRSKRYKGKLWYRVKWFYILFYTFLFIFYLYIIDFYINWIFLFCNSAFEQGHLDTWRYKNALIIIIIIINTRKTEWVDGNVVPSEMQREYFVKYTMEGRTKKKRKK